MFAVVGVDQPIEKIARPGETHVHFIIMMQTPTENEGESFAQYCQECLTILFEYHFATGKLGFPNSTGRSAKR